MLKIKIICLVKIKRKKHESNKMPHIENDPEEYQYK